MTMAAHQTQPASRPLSLLMRETANVFIVCKYRRRSRTLPLALPAILAKEKREGVPNPPSAHCLTQGTKFRIFFPDFIILGYYPLQQT